MNSVDPRCFVCDKNLFEQKLFHPLVLSSPRKEKWIKKKIGTSNAFFGIAFFLIDLSLFEKLEKIVHVQELNKKLADLSDSCYILCFKMANPKCPIEFYVWIYTYQNWEIQVIYFELENSLFKMYLSKRYLSKSEN